MLTFELIVHMLKYIVGGHVCCPLIHDSSFFHSFMVHRAKLKVFNVIYVTKTSQIILRLSFIIEFNRTRKGCMDIRDIIIATDIPVRSEFRRLYGNTSI